jgi:hypothetical protein
LWNYDEKGNISDFRKNIQELVDLFIDENNLSDSWECRSGFLFSVVDCNLVYSIPYTYKLNPHIEIRYQFLQWLEAKLK